IRIGRAWHWAPVVLGDSGGENRPEFAPIGDTVNVASRLEQMTRELGAEIIASGALVAAVETIAQPEAEHLLDGFVRYPPRPVRGRDAELEMFVLRRRALPDPPARPAP